MDRTLGKRVFSRGPTTSIHFWLGTLFITVASFPGVWIIIHDAGRLSIGVFEWLLLGMAGVWSFWIKVTVVHAKLHEAVRTGNTDHGTDFILDQAVQLAYVGLTLVGFAALGLLIALWRVVR